MKIRFKINIRYNGTSYKKDEIYDILKEVFIKISNKCEVIEHDLQPTDVFQPDNKIMKKKNVFKK
jgi:hypothetical protein